MDEPVQQALNELFVRLGRLPSTWPDELVFVEVPTLRSPPYTPSPNPLHPNSGVCRLDEGCVTNRDFLEFQSWLAGKIEFYQMLGSDRAKALTAELIHAAEGLE